MAGSRHYQTGLVRLFCRSAAAAAAGAVPMKAVTSQLQTAAAAGHSTAVATLATVTAAMQATWDPERGKKVRRFLPLSDERAALY